MEEEAARTCKMAYIRGDRGRPGIRDVPLSGIKIIRIPRSIKLAVSVCSFADEGVGQGKG